MATDNCCQLTRPDEKNNKSVVSLGERKSKRREWGLGVLFFKLLGYCLGGRADGGKEGSIERIEEGNKA